MTCFFQKLDTTGPRPLARNSGYTLVEILMATALGLLMLAGVASVFGTVGQSITNSRAVLEVSDQLRGAQLRLLKDLDGLTVKIAAPKTPRDQFSPRLGYFQYTEGPVGPYTPQEWSGYEADMVGVNTETGQIDTTVADMDDMLLFTTRSQDGLFLGRLEPGTNTIQSADAEVAWFVRGRTLYRRVLLVARGSLQRLDANGNGRIDPGEWSGGSFFLNNDISVRWETDASGSRYLMPNTLDELARPENRFMHQRGNYPYHPWRSNGWARLRLPTLGETASPAWFSAWFATPSGALPPVGLTVSAAPNNFFDAWTNPYPWDELDRARGTVATYNVGQRLGEDVILNNVVGFDVRVWDPGAPVLRNGAGNIFLPGDPGYYALLSGGGYTVVGYGAYVDLGYTRLAYGVSFPAGPNSQFYHTGNPGPTGSSPLVNLGGIRARVYDTWSAHYETDGIDQDGVLGPDQGTNGFDDDGDGRIDEVYDSTNTPETEAPPPYPAPLRGIQIKIRVFESDSRQIREVTVVEEFVGK